MNMKHIETIPLQGAMELYAYPFANQRHKRIDVSVVKGGKVEKFGTISGIGRGRLSVFKEENDFFVYLLDKESDGRKGVTEKYCVLMDKNGDEKRFAVPTVWLGNIRVLSNEYLLIGTKILLLSDLQEIMEIPMFPKKECRGFQCKYVQNLGNDTYIICYTGAANALLVVDAKQRTVKLRRDENGDSMENFCALKDGHFAFQWCDNHVALVNGKRTSNREEKIRIFDKDLNELQTIPLEGEKRKIYYFAVTADGTSLYCSTFEGKMFRYDLGNNEWATVSIPKHRRTWDFFGISQNCLCFQASAKKAAVYMPDSGKTQMFSFTEPITNCFMKEDVFYVVTGVDIERDITTWKITKEGIMNIYCLEGDK